jgi:hypothetical protein
MYGLEQFIPIAIIMLMEHHSQVEAVGVDHKARLVHRAPQAYKEL